MQLITCTSRLMSLMLKVRHNKPLYITVRCKDCLIGKVLIDNGSALNVLPKHILEEMPIDESHIKPSTMMARAYDGSPRPIIGTLEVELYVGPQMFLVTLQVMDIHPSYSMLLGRPWIHAAGAVASSLHQCLKYIMNGMLVTVKAEETVSMIKNVAVPFIEADDCKCCNPFLGPHKIYIKNIYIYSQRRLEK